MACRRTLVTLTSLVIVAIAYIYYLMTYVPDLPQLDLDKWWGPGERRPVDKSIRPFQVKFTDEMIADLRKRLSDTSLVSPLEDSAFTYGMNTNYLRTILDFWTRSYDFKGREAYLNQYPQFKANVQGLDIHYIHVKPNVTGTLEVVPLLALHGWPGSIREYYEIIPLLVTPKKSQNFVFEVIIPSLPGYGFSQTTTKKDMGAPEMAVIFRNLMNQLGFNSYVVQGGDWGAMIGSVMSVLFPREVIGYHTTLVNLRLDMPSLKLALGSLYPSALVEEKYQDRIYPLSKTILFLLQETGYLHQQMTKPDTVGVGLRDSPAGLAAYILEKFSTGTNPGWRNREDGGLTIKYTLTDLLDNVMIYWSTGTITSSMRLYAESGTSFFKNLLKQPISVPSAVTNFRHEIWFYPESLVRDRFLKLQQFTYYDDCGHFGAFECPKELSDDIWSAVEKFLTDYKKSEH